MSSVKLFVLLAVVYITMCAVVAHGPPRARDKEDIAIGRKMAGIGSAVHLALTLQPVHDITTFYGRGMQFFTARAVLMAAKWCSMAKVCNHDRVPVCGVNHAGDIMGFKDLCDMFDFNCLRKRNFKQSACPADPSMLTVSRRPSGTYYDD